MSDEIDRLRAENERLTAEIVRLRAKVAKEIREAAKGSVYAKGRSHTFICGLQDGYEAAAQIACNDHRIIDLALENENERLREALREIASGKYSGIVLTSYPPQDPAVNRARAALGEQR